MTLQFRGTQNPALFIIFAIAANHSVFRLGAMPAWWIAIVAVVIAAISILAPDLEIPGPPRPAFAIRNLIIGAVICLPALASLVLGWNREFPFSGDQSFHVKQIYYMAFWWAQPVGTPATGILGRTLGYEDFYSVLAHPARLLWSRAVIALIVVAGSLIAYRRKPIFAVVFSALALLTWGALEQTIYLRYPGAGYVIDLIFSMPAFLTGHVELSGRIPNVLAVAVWIFALRPWLLKRWPDLSILPAAIFVFWQKDLLYYIDSTYLEPWAFVFIFLAIELVIVRRHEGVPLACLMIGCAACFKEPFIIALPLVWLAGIFPWQSLMSAWRTSLYALIGGFPFLFYYVARKSVPLSDIVIDRTYDPIFRWPAFSEYAMHFAYRMTQNFPGPSAVALALALMALLYFSVRRGVGRFQVLCMAAAGAELIIFFALDEVSQYWAGYFRFFLPAFACLCAGLIMAGDVLPSRRTALIAAVMILLQAQGAYIAVARSAGPGSERNFVEHYEAALVFPIKYLLAAAQQAGFLTKRDTVLANQPDDTVRSLPGVNVTFGPLGTLSCGCSAETPNVMALFVRYTNLSAAYSTRAPVANEYGPLPDRDQLWRKNRAERPACLAQMHRTCGHVIERSEGGEVVGALGTR